MSFFDTIAVPSPTAEVKTAEATPTEVKTAPSRNHLDWIESLIDEAEVKAEVKAEAKAEAKPKAEAKAEAKAESKPKPKAEVKTAEVKAEAEVKTAEATPAEGIEGLIDPLGNDIRETHIGLPWNLRARGAAPSATEVLDYLRAEVAGAQAQTAGMIALSAIIARVNVLFRGDAGEGKSITARAVLSLFTGAQSAMIQFSEGMASEDVLGPISINALRYDAQLRRIDRSPLTRPLWYLDEIEKARDDVQHAMFSALSERTIMDAGREFVLNPLAVIATANEQFSSDAILDRFGALVEFQTAEMSESLRDLRSAFRTQSASTPSLSAPALKSLQTNAQSAFDGFWANPNNLFEKTVSEVIKGLNKATRERNSKRRIVAGIRLASGWAALHGRDHLMPQDAWPMSYALNERMDQEAWRKGVERTLNMVRDLDISPFPTMPVQKTVEELAAEAQSAVDALK